MGHTPDVLTGATADMTLALMLAAMRRLPEAEAQVREGRWTSWAPDGLLGRDLGRSTVLIVGRGRIGQAVAERVRGFGAEVITAGRGDELEPLLEEADVVTLHCPLTEDTRGLIGEAELRAMGPEAYLVNTARGPVVDTGALVRALSEGWIAGAGLDVTDPEPLPGDHPLLEAPNLAIAPHLGSATHYTRAAMADLAVDNLLAALDGQPMPHTREPGGLDGRLTRAGDGGGGANSAAMSRRTVSTCVVCAFALAPAAFAADVPGGAQAPPTGGAVAPASRAPALAPTPAEAVQQAPAPVNPVPVAQAPPPVAPVEPVAMPAVVAQPSATELAAAPRLRPTSAVTAQSDDDVVEVPVPRERRRSTPAPAQAAPVAQAPRLPMTGFDLGLFTAAGLVILGTGVGLSAAVGPAPRRR